jgi:hypothetical protein
MPSHPTGLNMEASIVLSRIFTGQCEGSPPFGTVSRQKGVSQNLVDANALSVLSWKRALIKSGLL